MQVEPPWPKQLLWISTNYLFETLINDHWQKIAKSQQKQRRVTVKGVFHKPVDIYLLLIPTVVINPDIFKLNINCEN